MSTKYIIYLDHKYLSPHVRALVLVLVTRCAETASALTRLVVAVVEFDVALFLDILTLVPSEFRVFSLSPFGFSSSQ